MGDAKGNVHRSLRGRQRIMVEAARDVEEVTWTQGHFHPDRALVGIVVGFIESLVHWMRDRAVEPTLVDPPGLFALDMKRENLVRIEMGIEGLPLAP